MKVMFLGSFGEAERQGGEEISKKGKKFFYASTGGSLRQGSPK